LFLGLFGHFLASQKVPKNIPDFFASGSRFN